MTTQSRVETKHSLLILSPVAIPEPQAPKVALPRKYVVGLEEFAARWQGSVTVLLPRARKRDDNLDYVSVDRVTAPYIWAALPDNELALCEYLRSASVVMASMISRYIRIPSLCASVGVPFVLDADLTPEIREQIIRSENNNPLLRWRRIYWQRNMEKNYTAMVRAAHGAHLQGPVAYETYAPLSRSPLLYFNTRTSRSMLPTVEQLEARAASLRRGAPLRLVYSGRWRAMKGILELPRIAVELRRLGVHAEWTIFGSGMLEQELARAVSEAGLNNMHLRGEVPFPDLMRFAAHESDLFVCCHLQGDPSTTFIEMLSAGVPLIGYNTPGLRSIITLSDAGWLTPLGNSASLASQIAELNRSRECLVAASLKAVEFAGSWTFEDIMAQRVAHLQSIAGNANSPEN